MKIRKEKCEEKHLHTLEELQNEFHWKFILNFFSYYLCRLQRHDGKGGNLKMGNFVFHKCNIEGLYVIEPKVFGDERGYFMETYHYEDFKANGLDKVFVQDNQSLSRKGVLRGLHFQKEHSQGKLVRVLTGSVYDVAVDLRKASSTYGKYYGVILSEENKKMFYVPEGFAHGFLVMSDIAVFSYKCTDFYHPEVEDGIIWNDPEIGIDWPISADIQPIISDKDTKHPTLKQSGFAF